MMHAIRKLLFRFPGHYVVALIVAVAVGVFRHYTLPDGIGIRFTWYEVFSVSGYVTLLFGALMTVTYFGAFDLFGYVFSPGRTGENKKYKSYTHYVEQKAEKRAKEGYFFVPYYVVGAVLILVSLLFA